MDIETTRKIAYVRIHEERLLWNVKAKLYTLFNGVILID